MSRASVWSIALLASLVVVALSGCNTASPTADKSTGKATDEHAHDHAHDHPHEGPHGGNLIELGEEEYHGEWTHDDAGKVAVYILDGAAKKTVPIAAEKVTIDVKVGENLTSFDLPAINRTTGDMPTAYQFETVEPKLKGALEAAGKGIDATLKVDINGKPFVGKIEPGHSHDHDHKH